MPSFPYDQIWSAFVSFLLMIFLAKRNVDCRYAGPATGNIFFLSLPGLQAGTPRVPGGDSGCLLQHHAVAGAIVHAT
jgi:hypothetical protein